MRKQWITIWLTCFLLAWGSPVLAGLTDILSAKAKPSSVSLLNLHRFLKESREKQASSQHVKNVLAETSSLQAVELPAEPYLLKATEALAKGVSPKKSLPALRQTRDHIKLAGRLSDQLLADKPSAEVKRLKPKLFNQLYGSLLQGVSPSQLAQSTRQLGPRWTWAQLLESLTGIRTKALIAPQGPLIHYSQPKGKKYKYYKYKKKRKGPPAHAPAHGYRRKK